MAETYTTYYERSLQDTATWAVAVVCFVLLAISLLAEHFLHLFEKWLERKHKPTLVEAVEKVKSELMLLGFISLLLTVFQNYISEICVPRDVAITWRPCNDEIKLTAFPKGQRRLLGLWDEEENEGWMMPRRSLATKGKDYCSEKGDKLAFVTAYGIHQLHIFIFVLAIFHVLFCIITMAIATLKMRRWKKWEGETKTLEYQYYNDPERFRFARETSFGRRHLHAWSRSPVTIWIVCFFRQFFASVTKVDYFALRHGFIMAHLTPESEMSFDFQKYIHKSLEEDFKEVVGISPVIWFTAVLFLLTNTHGWYSYLWMPFIPLIILVVVGTKLQVIITRMGVRIQERGDVVKGTPVVQPGDDLFWFGQPRFILFLIHFVLFQNAFQLAFFAWSTYEYGIRNCFHQKLEDIIIRTSMGVVIQVVCSYVTMPLYALVTQMGTSMKPTIFHDRVATALKSWHHTAKRNAKEISKHSNSPLSSRPATPEHGSSPMHLLHGYHNRSIDSLQASPKSYHNNLDPWAHVHVGSSYSPRGHEHDDNGQGRYGDDDHDDDLIREHVELMIGPNNVAQDSGHGHTQLDEIDIVRPSDFTFGK